MRWEVEGCEWCVVRRSVGEREEGGHERGKVRGMQGMSVRRGRKVARNGIVIIVKNSIEKKH